MAIFPRETVAMAQRRRGRIWRVGLSTGLFALGMALLLAGPTLQLADQAIAPAQAQAVPAEPADTAAAEPAAQEAPPSALTGPRTAMVLTVDDIISPATALYVQDNIKAAVGQHRFIVIRMDTPGGLDTSMRDINDAILNSPIPVATFVAPTGSRAASAGTYILYASHVAAMAPGTTLGAATPVQLGGGGGEGDSGGEEGQPGTPDTAPSEPVQPVAPVGNFLPAGGVPLANFFPLPDFGGEAQSDAQPAEGGDGAADGETATTDGTGTVPRDGLTASERKAINDAAAYIRELAKLRGRNAEWAEKAVREAASLGASEALAINVVDVIADDVRDLLEKIDGRQVEVAGVGTVTLRTAGLQAVEVEKSWVQELLSVITNPNIAFILMQLGVLGLIIELYNPGAIFPGAVGVICLILGLVSLAVLPINYGGLVLLIIGVLFMGLELVVITGGLLAGFGVIAFAVGAFILFDTNVPGFELSPLLVVVSTAIMGGLVFAIVTYALAAQRRGVVTGAESVKGSKGTVLTWDGAEGYVLVQGENWKAKATQPLQPGAAIEVIRVDGLTLWVRPDPNPS